MPRPGRMTTESAKDFKGTLRQLLQTMSHYKLPLITAIVFAILSTIFNIAGPKVLAKATTALATGWIAKLRGTGSIDFVYIGRVLLFLLGMYLLSSAFSFIQGLADDRSFPESLLRLPPPDQPEDQPPAPGLL